MCSSNISQSFDCLESERTRWIVKPRLPVSVVLKENTYDDSEEPEQIAAYDIVARDYYANRSGNKKSQSWSEQMTGLLGKEARPHMKQFLANQGFEMK